MEAAITKYVITRAAPKPGMQLSSVQRLNPLYSESPSVLGRILRPGSAPLEVSPELFNQNRVRLQMLERAEAIHITAHAKEVLVGGEPQAIVETAKKDTHYLPPEVLAETPKPVEAAPVVDSVPGLEEAVPGLPLEPAKVEAPKKGKRSKKE